MKAPAFLLVLAASARLASACDSTSCLLQTRGDNGLPARHTLQVDLSYRVTDQDTFLQGSASVDTVRRPWVDFERGTVWPGFHRERGGLEQFVQADLLYGVAGRAALQLSIPIYTRRRYDVDHGANPYRYLTTGVGDVVLGARAAIADRGRLVAGVGFKTASGRADEMDAAERYILEPMIQPGTGALALTGSLQWARTLRGVSVTAAGSYQRNTTNGLDYRSGDDLIGSLTAGHRLAGPLSGTLQVKMWRKYRSTFFDQPVPGTGGRVLYVTPGLRVSLPARTSVYSFVQVPAYRYVNEEQVAPTIGGVVGISKSF